MNPERKLITILLYGIMCQPPLGALEISGRTTQGMPFRGEVITLRDSILEIGPTSGKDGTPMGIPLSAVKTIQIDPPVKPDPEFISRLELLVPALPYCDRPTLYRILEWIKPMREPGKWPDVYLWASRVLSGTTDPGLQCEARLMEAQSLMEMGLLNRLESRLELLNARIEPMEASSLLCELNARLCEWRGDSEGKRFWSELPGLRIPAIPGTKP